MLADVQLLTWVKQTNIRRELTQGLMWRQFSGFTIFYNAMWYIDLKYSIFSKNPK
jgi:hypothetical protein